MNWIFSVFVGALTGVLSGFGIGGGTLLILWLTLVCGFDQLTAGGINLLYFVACALPALWGHVKNGLVEKPAALWSSLLGVPACMAASALASALPLSLLRRGFGIFLLCIGIREIWGKK